GPPLDGASSKVVGPAGSVDTGTRLTTLRASGDNRIAFAEGGAGKTTSVEVARSRTCTSNPLLPALTNATVSPRRCGQVPGAMESQTEAALPVRSTYAKGTMNSHFPSGAHQLKVPEGRGAGGTPAGACRKQLLDDRQ